MSARRKPLSVAVIGAGPAGLTAAFALAREGVHVTVLEADPRYVGGIARTVEYKGYRLDIGGHRFFSKSKEIEELWAEMLPDGMLTRPRSSRIYYRKKFFSYPLKPLEALATLGLVESVRCLASYLKAKLFPLPDPRNFQEWVTNRFGERLFSIFFKTYTEKVWGMDCRDISADWASQRIQGLSLSAAIRDALARRLTRRDTARDDGGIRTLAKSFRYPRRGPGMLWEACAARIREMGGDVRLGHKVTRLQYDRERGRWTLRCESADGALDLVCDEVISSAPLAELPRALSPPLPPPALAAAGALKYRDFIVVGLILKDHQRLSDNWLYIHEPGVKVGRVQNFKSWSPEMVPDPSMACFGLEYFCRIGDELWSNSDEELVARATRELEELGLCRKGDVVDGFVVRQPKAYPVYDEGYADQLERLRAALAAQFPTLHPVGRNGMHRYNNQDHAMMTGLLTARNILSGRRLYDVWKVNTDAEYHEEAPAAEAAPERHVPTPARRRAAGE